MAVRIKDVARKAGVSVTTVSRVLNNEKYVTDELKQKVLAAIEELDYSPNHIARSLVRQKTNLIGVIVPDLASSFYSTILSSVEEEASENGYNLLVCNIIEDIDKELKYLNVFQEMRVEGIIIMHEKINNEIKQFLDKSNIPVIFSSVKPVNRKFHSVIIDDYEAAYEATEYLISLGHTRIGFIGGDMRDITSGQNRYAAYRNALATYEIPIVYEYIKFGDYKLQSGYALMEELLQCDPMPTAVFAVSDDMALGAMNCISDHQLKVPENISIIGFDGSPFTEIIRPRLTSMEQPIQRMGTESVKALLRLIAEPSSLNQDIILPHELVIRDSTRQIK
ncbi:LacI family DNA-binding transcriptional regulator [Paenibacillus thiaminolyticus]|uniref:LacI family DNA-binding transcriptional regulator n=1 Tax=Paenibacillus thiaminolyticus TaxID=49283 RepID=UPI003D2AC8F0